MYCIASGTRQSLQVFLVTTNKKVQQTLSYFWVHRLHLIFLSLDAPFDLARLSGLVHVHHVHFKVGTISDPEFLEFDSMAFNSLYYFDTCGKTFISLTFGIFADEAFSNLFQFDTCSKILGGFVLWVLVNMVFRNSTMLMYVGSV